PSTWPDEAAEKVELSRLTRADRANKRDEIARVAVEVESLKHMDLHAATPIGLAEPARADQALAVPATIDADHRFSLVGYFFTRTDWPSRNCLAPVVTT